MGDRFGGWGLWLDDSKPRFAYALSNQPAHKFVASSDTALTPGNHVIRAIFKYDGGGIGNSAAVTLLVDEKEVAQVKVPQTIAVRFSLDETFDIGEDAGTPVVEDYAASDGDQAMLEYTTIGNPRPSFGLIVHHTDAEREYAYDAKPEQRQTHHRPRCRQAARRDRRGHEVRLEHRRC